MAKQTVIPDLPIDRPTTIEAMRKLISDTYTEQPWSIDEARRYEAMHGLEPKRLTERSEAELRTILDAMEASRMVLLKN